ncbi:replication protein RepA4 [Escherichia coli]|nr:replication protein RepA4 [Escherichia coli]
MREFLCAVGVVPTRVYPKSGRISALAGRQGRLRACKGSVGISAIIHVKEK